MAPGKRVQLAHRRDKTQNREKYKKPRHPRLSPFSSSNTRFLLSSLCLFPSVTVDVLSSLLLKMGQYNCPFSHSVHSDYCLKASVSNLRRKTASGPSWISPLHLIYSLGVMVISPNEMQTCLPEPPLKLRGAAYKRRDSEANTLKVTPTVIFM